MSIADDLAGLVKLRDDGEISPQEFELQKARLLSSTAQPASCGSVLLFLIGGLVVVVLIALLTLR